MAEHDYPADEQDLTSEEFDALAEGGEEVELVRPPAIISMMLTNGGAPLLGQVMIFNPRARVAPSEPKNGEQLATAR